MSRNPGTSCVESARAAPK